MFDCGTRSVKVRNDSYSRSRWFGKKEICYSGISFFPLSLSHSLSLLKSLSLVKFSALFSGPNGGFLLVGCDSYITPLMTRTSSCFLQPRLKVNLSGGGALQHPVLCIQCASETHTRRLFLLCSVYVSHSFSDRQRIEGDTDGQKLLSFTVFSSFFILSLSTLTFSAFSSLRNCQAVFQHPAVHRALNIFSFSRRRSSGCPPLHLKGK